LGLLVGIELILFITQTDPSDLSLGSRRELLAEGSKLDFVVVLKSGDGWR